MDGHAVSSGYAGAVPATVRKSEYIPIRSRSGRTSRYQARPFPPNNERAGLRVACALCDEINRRALNRPDNPASLTYALSETPQDDMNDDWIMCMCYWMLVAIAAFCVVGLLIWVIF